MSASPGNCGNNFSNQCFEALFNRYDKHLTHLITKHLYLNYTLNRGLGIFVFQSNLKFWKKAILLTRSVYSAKVAMVAPAAGTLCGINSRPWVDPMVVMVVAAGISS